MSKKASKANPNPVNRGLHKSGQKIRQKAKGKPGRAKVTPYHRNLGPMGEFSDVIVIQVTLTDKLDQFKTTASELNYKNVRTIIDQAIYRPLREYMMGTGRGGGGIISTMAPQDTGALREALEAGIIAGKKTIDQFSETSPFTVEMGTEDIPYAKPVNKMPTRWLKHPAKYHRNIGRRGDPLSDPDARQGWYNLILVNSRNKAQRLFKKFVGDMAGMLKPYQSATFDPRAMTNKLFKARFK